MTIRRLLRRTYHLLDRLALARLPDSVQRTIITGLLSVARWLLPSGRWPTSPDALLVRRTLHPPSKPKRSLPDWALNDLQDLSLRIDPLLNPGAVLSARPEAFLVPVHWTQAGQTYQRILQWIGSRQFDTIILVPWLKRGGADLGALHHARACHEEFGQRTLIISTEIGDSPWSHRLGEAISFLELGAELATLSTARDEPQVVLARLLVQLQPDRIHIINSHLAWDMVEKFGKAIRQKTHIFASLYCDEITADGRRDGLAQRYLPSCSPWLDAVITDNNASPNDWVSTLGVAPELFHVVHFPAPEFDSIPCASRDTEQPKSLLWASRLERQKRPDLLVALAKATPKLHWDIHGAALSDGSEHLGELRKLHNVTLHGSYERFSDIVQPEHLAYIYTSSWDGLPNVLLEATAIGIPVIAPDVGGIGDLIPRDLLMPANADTADYAEAIGRLSHSEERARWLSLQQVNQRSFTWENFISTLRKLPDYAP